jgi:hypothetical protein
MFFTPEGGEAYLRDLPDATLIRLNSGHFAIRTARKRSLPASKILQLRSGELIAAGRRKTRTPENPPVERADYVGCEAALGRMGARTNDD